MSATKACLERSGVAQALYDRENSNIRLVIDALKAAYLSTMRVEQARKGTRAAFYSVTVHHVITLAIDQMMSGPQFV
jgi:hypothetical protein